MSSFFITVALYQTISSIFQYIFGVSYTPQKVKLEEMQATPDKQEWQELFFELTFVDCYIFDCIFATIK